MAPVGTKDATSALCSNLLPSFKANGNHGILVGQEREEVMREDMGECYKESKK